MGASFHPSCSLYDRTRWLGQAGAGPRGSASTAAGGTGPAAAAVAVRCLCGGQYSSGLWTMRELSLRPDLRGVGAVVKFGGTVVKKMVRAVELVKSIEE